MVDDVVPDAARLDGAVQSLIGQSTRGGPRAIAMAKRAFITKDEPAAFAACFEADESREGMNAFIEKRKAAWVKA
jgi:enoyl-CoA hydratase/carnithine racemase